MYYNYHKHDHYGNPWMADSVAKPEEYCKRAKELGHKSVFTVNHGITGNIFEWLELSELYDLKMIYGFETYYVPNRFEKDRSNKHLILIAKNNEGVLELNDIMSESHISGFYYRPRIDKELLFSINPKNFIVTSACIAGVWDDTELVCALNRKFGNNFFLEVQSHNVKEQREMNQRVLRLSKELNIPIIHANDSHYIYKRDSRYREIFQKAKGSKFTYEDEMSLDYPSEDTIYERYERQGILTRQQVSESLQNTMVFDECETITLINKDIKLPSISDNPTEDLKDLLRNHWLSIRDTIPKEKHQKYLEALRYEMDIIEKTHMENYFLIDYNVVKRGQEVYDGKLTNTGRGSAPSFYTTKSLGLTDIDRVSAPVTLYPTRFMSVERILGTKSLPDIDLNTTDRVPFIKATEDLLGKENCAWMLAWKPLQAASAFKTYCRGIGIEASVAERVSSNLDEYAEDKKWKPIIEESKRFIGVIDSVSESPCSMVLYDKPVRKELGLIRTKKGQICCLLDGYNCDKYKYLKNDYLTVIVWAIIRDVCRLANIPIPSIDELNNLLDDKTFDIYAQGLTSTINQADSEFATGLVKRYKPKSVGEMSAFVAIIRPGCAKLLQDFVDRKPYTTGVKELDELLIEGNHRMIYQELIMKYLIWLGIPETGSYDIIKKISKKKFKEAELTELKDKLHNGWIKQVGTEEGFEGTWQIVQDAARYSFNASHSLAYAYDSLYGAYLKSHYPLEYYTVALNYYSDDMVRTNRLISELSYFGITLKPIQFRHSRDTYSISKEDNSIYKGIKSVKDMSKDVADELFELGKESFESFIDLLYAIKIKTNVGQAKIKVLIELGFFDEFGDTNKLLKLQQFFEHYYDKKTSIKQINKSILETENISMEMLSKESIVKITPKIVKVNVREFLNDIENNIKFKKRTIYENVQSEIIYLGYSTIKNPSSNRIASVISVDTKYSPKINFYSVKNGTSTECKINKKRFAKNPLVVGDVVVLNRLKYQPKKKMDDKGNFVDIPNTKELWIDDYDIILPAPRKERKK